MNTILVLMPIIFKLLTVYYKLLTFLFLLRRHFGATIILLLHQNESLKKKIVNGIFLAEGKGKKDDEWINGKNMK